MNGIKSAKGAARTAKWVEDGPAPRSVLRESWRRWVGIAAAALLAGLTAHLAWSQEANSTVHGRMKDRERMLLTQPLPKLDGGNLKTFLVEVSYGPGEASPPHSHPCPVIGYVVAGAFRSQVKGQPETIYKAGESFYEAPNAIHVVSGNASAIEPAKFVAYLLCDRDTPLSVAVPESKIQGGK